MPFTATNREGLVSIAGHLRQLQGAAARWEGREMTTRFWFRSDRVDEIARMAVAFGEAVNGLEAPREGGAEHDRHETLVRLSHELRQGALMMRNGLDRDSDLLARGLEKYRGAVGEVGDVVSRWREGLDPAHPQRPDWQWEPYGFGE